VLLIANCTVTEKRSASGEVEYSVSLLAPITVLGGSATEARSVRAAGPGIGITSGALQIGYFGISVVYLDPDCRVVLIPTDDAQLNRFKDILGGITDLCSTASNGGPIATKDRK
jgi:hypothetical protein